MFERSSIPVSLLSNLEDQRHPQAQVKVNVAVKDPTAWIVELGPDNDVAIPRNLDHIFRNAPIRICVVQLPLSLLLNNELSCDFKIIIILAPSDDPVPAPMLVYGVSNGPIVSD